MGQGHPGGQHQGAVGRSLAGQLLREFPARQSERVNAEARPGSFPMTYRKLNHDPLKIASSAAASADSSAALALLRRGIDVDVYEQSAELKEVGAGISDQLERHPRSLCARARRSACASPGPPVEAARYATGALARPGTGSSSVRPPPAATGHRHLMLHRGDLHGILADAVQRPEGECDPARQEMRRH